MNITKILFFATALTMLLISCDKEEIQEATFAETRTGGVTYVSVYLEDTAAICTKAMIDAEETVPESEEERKIHNLSFFVFNADGERDPDYGYHTFNYTGSQYTFAISSGEDKTIIAAANLQHVGNLDNANLETVRGFLGRTVETRQDLTLHGAPKAGETSSINAVQGNAKVVKMQVSRTYTK